MYIILYIILYIPLLPTGGVPIVDLQQWSFIPFLVAERQDFSAGSRAAIGGGVLDNYQYRIQVSRLGKGLNIGRKTMKKNMENFLDWTPQNHLKCRQCLRKTKEQPLV
jgi:hypothetical protein